MKDYIQKNSADFYKTLKELCAIPAPSHHEEKRAEYCLNFFKSIGAKNAYIDDLKNVIWELNCEGSDSITVFAAHTDTVFPDTEPMPYYEEDGKIHCPGVGDDTASVVGVLYTAKYFAENSICPKDGFMFVCNSCEEGLGNLDGTRYLFKKFGKRVKQFITIDTSTSCLVNNCVGSERYRVTVKTPGGHSFSKFGNANAIAKISEIISEIYKIQVPHEGDSKTTYNVGTISGGTSVNTIAQQAEMLCEYRSDNVNCLEIMRNKFAEIFEKAKAEDVEVLPEIIGVRPCANGVDRGEMDRIYNICDGVYNQMTGEHLAARKASTDCNIPMSMGIPAVDIGCYRGNGAHTREEYIIKDSLVPGIEYILGVALKLAEAEL